MEAFLGGDCDLNPVSCFDRLNKQMKGKGGSWPSPTCISQDALNIIAFYKTGQIKRPLFETGDTDRLPLLSKQKHHSSSVVKRKKWLVQGQQGPRDIPAKSQWQIGKHGSQKMLFVCFVFWHHSHNWWFYLFLQLCLGHYSISYYVPLTMKIEILSSKNVAYLKVIS